MLQVFMIILNVLVPMGVLPSSVDSALEKERAWGQQGSAEFHKGSKLEAPSKRFGGAFTVDGAGSGRFEEGGGDGAVF